MKTEYLLRVAASGMAVLGAAHVGVAQAQSSAEADIDALIAASSTPAGAVSSARSQAQAGDLTGAAATLERALLANPNANDVRVFYAALLCQLDDPQGARVELTKLDGQAISDADWSAANAACGGTLARPVAPKGGAETGLIGQVWAGLAYDSNASGQLTTQFDILNLPIATKGGLSAIAGIRFSGKSDGYYDGGGAYGSASLSAKNSIDGPDQSYEMGELRAGFGRQSEQGQGFAIGGVFRHARILNKPYVSEAGGEAQISFAAGEGGRLTLRGEAVHQTYKRNGPGVGGNGMKLDLALNYEKQIEEGRWFVAGVAVESKEGRLKQTGYVGGRVYAAYQAPLGGGGSYFNLSSTLRHIAFKDKPPVLDRKDLRATGRAAIGVPLSENGLIVEIGASYTMRNVTNRVTANPPPALVFRIADYNSVGADARLIWKF